MGKPNFFIVGAARSGTTAMCQYLAAHPDIFLPFYKEPHYFGSDLIGSRMEQFRGRPEKYLALFRETKHQKRVGEGSVWYLCSHNAAAEIKAFDPAAKIIIMLRAPADMIYSYYHQSIYTGNEILPTFEAALAAEPDRKAGRCIPPMAHTISSLFYSELVHYADQVQRYLDVFGRDAVHIIIYDDFKADTAREYRKTLEFLDVDASFRTEFNVINANKRVRYSIFRRSLMRLGIHPMLLKDRLTYLATTSGVVPKPLRNYLVTGTIQAYTRYAGRQTMNPATRQALNKQFLPEIERLSLLLDRDLTYWCQNEAAL